jgi:cytoskeletal protein CcmA (bactofilin family)
MWRKTNEVQPSPDTSSRQVQPVIKADETPRPVATAAPAPAPVNTKVSKITSGLKIVGELSGSSDLYIDGEVQGKVHLADGRVTVGPNGRIQAEVQAREIVIEGSVQGNLKALESARLGSSSRVLGSISTPRLGIDEGARIRGRVETTTENHRRGNPVPEPFSESEPLRPVTVGFKGE